MEELETLRTARLINSLSPRLLTVASVLLASSFAQPLSAQSVVPPGAMIIDGYGFNCGPTPTYLVGSEINDVAMATPGGIYLNWPIFNNMPTSVKAFIYAHECAHMIFGSNENVADAWAIKTGRNQGWINGSNLHQICASVVNSAGDWTHLPGPLRCLLFVQAYYTP